MLKAKYYSDFKNSQNCILIIGDREGFKTAGSYFRNINAGSLTASGFIQFENVHEFGENPLIFSKDEYLLIADIFLKLANQGMGSHEYFSIVSAPHIEFLISCCEYRSLP